jgi:hypothetical protein
MQEEMKMNYDLKSNMGIQTAHDLESDTETNDTSFGIIRENRYELALACYIQWTQKRLEAIKAAFAYTSYENGNIIDQKVLRCNGITSACQLVLYGTLIGLQSIPLDASDALVIIKTTEMAVINGINTDLDYWVANDYYTKGGSPVKDRGLWEEIYKEKQKHLIIALPLETQEKISLQSVSKALVLGNLKR